MKTREIEINGVISIPESMTEDEFISEFIQFIESKDYSFGGGFSDMTDFPIDIETMNHPVISYCDLPEAIREDSVFENTSPDSYIEVKLYTKKEQEGFDSNFDLENWIIDQYPIFEGRKVLIHIDY